MSTYRVKVSFKDDSDFYRIIDIREDVNLDVLHAAILKSIDFEDGELASFYLNYENRKERLEFCLSEMQREDDTTLLMNEVKVREILTKPGKRLTYVYDFLNMWIFDAELIEICDMTKLSKAFEVSDSYGDAPSQASYSGFSDDDLSDEDLRMLKDMIEKNDDYLGSDDEYSNINRLEDFDDFEDIENFDKDYDGYDDNEGSVDDDRY